MAAAVPRRPPSASTPFRATDDAAQKPVIKWVMPMLLDTSKEFVAGRPKMQGALRQIETSGGTPLYEAVLTAYEYQRTHYVPGHTNRLIVVTDGADQDAKSKVRLQKLLATLPRTPDADRPIEIAFVALGPDADEKTLNRIAAATGQKVITAGSAADIVRKLPQVMVP